MHDLRIALRTLARSPGYTLVALITLVLGIGANTSVFSIVNGVLLSPLGFPEEDRLIRAAEVNGNGGIMDAAWRNFVDWRDQAQSFDGLVAHSSGETTVLGTGEPLRLGVASVSEGFLQTMRVAPVLGRALLPGDHRLGVEPVALVSHTFWRTQLGGSPNITERTLVVSGLSARVVGVMPPGFGYPGAVDIWYPLELDEPNDSRTSHNYEVLGRLKPGITLAQAKAELDAITRRILEREPLAAQEQGFKDFFPHSASVLSLREALVGNAQRPLWILLGAALLVLLVACTNLASTTLARGTAREHEYAIRHALGAGRGRMMRALISETITLSTLGALLGLLLAHFVLKLVPVLAPAGVPRLAEVQLDARVAAFTILLSVMAALLSGLLPGMKVSANALRTLRSGARAIARGRVNVWKSLIACEVALAFVLLIGSGLLLRSFWTVLDVQPGFDTSGILTATVNPPSIKYNNNQSKRIYYEALLDRLENLPGVQAAGLTVAAPMSWISNGMVDIDAGPQPTLTGDYQLASPGYFRALNIPLLRGRFFEPGDHETAEHVVLVNRSFAETAWPGQDPIGKRITGGGMDDYWNQKKWATVIGLVGDVRQRDLTLKPRPTLYFSYRQRPFRTWSMTAVLRPRTGPPVALIPQVREVVRAIDGDVPVRFATIEQRVSNALAPRRFVLTVILAFASVALVLASVGVYGVVAYAVERRRKEIGIRMAIGAQPGSVRRMLQREYMSAAAAGALAGVILASALTRLLAALLFETRTTDPLTFAAVLIVLAIAAWIASLLPAWRSTRVDPLETMRTS
jgi:predicted permease